MAWKELTVQITGAAPLLLHNGELANPTSEGAKALKQVSSKRNKTDADHEEMARLEWHYGLYRSNGKVILPGVLLEACLAKAAAKKKLKKVVQSGVYVPDDAVLEYDGPSDIDALWKDGRFTFSIGVKVSQARVYRTRPRFDGWGGKFRICFDDEQLNQRDLEQILGIAGPQIGLGDWRPKFGRFTYEVIA